MLVDLSIIIVNWNTCDLLDKCLTSIYQYPFKYHLEIIVVDNSSYDDSIKMVKFKYPKVKLIINKKNEGFSKANNIGFKNSCGKYAMFLNSDTLVKKNSLDQLVNYLDTHKDVSIIGPKLVNLDGSIQISALKLPSLSNSFWESVYVFLRLNFLEKFTARYAHYDCIIPNAGWLSGACIIFRRDVFENIGGWNEDTFMYGEDVLIGLKANKLGYKLSYYPEAKIVHIGSASMKHPEKKIFMIYKSRALVRQMFFSPTHYFLYLIFTNFLLLPFFIIFPLLFCFTKNKYYLKLFKGHFSSFIYNCSCLKDFIMNKKSLPCYTQ